MISRWLSRTNKIILRCSINSILEFHKWTDPFSYDKNMYYKLSSFSYKPDYVGSLHSSVEHSLKMAEQYMIPVFNEVTDLDSCIEFFSKYQNSVLSIHYPDEDFGNRGRHYFDEGLLYIKTCDREAFIEKRERFIERDLTISDHWKSGFTKEYHEQKWKAYKEGNPRLIALANEIYGNHEWCANALIELERRKVENIEILRSYGISM